MPEDIRKIIADGILAPSGENCQPWKLKVRGTILEVHLLLERDQSLYSWGQRASYMANGALIENIALSAQHFNYETKIHLLPQAGDLNLIARIEFKKRDTSRDDDNRNLYPFIKERCTNRKAYSKIKLTDQEIKEITECSDSRDGIRIFLTDKAENITMLGKAGSVNEGVMMSNEHLHEFFFSHVNWTREEDDQKKIGFFIDTLELPPPARVGFKLFKNWKLTRFFNKMGLYNMIAKQNAEIYSASAGIGVITMKDMSIESFIQAGRVMERLWLTSTKLGLSFQPLTGVLFFMYRIMANDAGKFSSEQVQVIKNAYDDIRKSFDLAEGAVIGFMFRVGNGGLPSARSVRFSVDEITEFQK